MPVRKPAILTLAALTFALSPSAFAKTIYNSGDWSLDDSQPEISGKGTCVAATATYLGNYGAYSLNVVMDKTGARPIEVMIRPFRSPSKAITFRAVIESGASYSFVKLPRTAKGEDTFWNLPVGTDKFIAALKASSQLSVVASGDMGELPFSMTGATAVLSKMDKLCVVSPALNSAEFEKAFLPAEMSNVDIAALDQAKAGAIRDLIGKGARAYQNIAAKKAELSALENRNSKLLQEKVSLPGEIEQLKRSEIPNLNSAREAAQGRIDKNNVDIAALESSLTGKESSVAAAQKNLDAASAKIKPVVPEHSRLEALMQADDSRQAEASKKIEASDAEITAKNRELSDRKGEADTLRTNIPKNIEDTRRARTALTQAETALRGFDTSALTKRRRDADRAYQALDKEIRGLTQNVKSAEQALAAVTADHGSEQKLAEAKQSLADAQGALQAKSADRDAISRRIEQDVDAEREELAKREAEAKRYVAELGSQRDKMDSRARDLNQYVITGLQKEISEMQAKRAALAANLASAKDAVAKSADVLRKYDASVNFTALNAEVEKAKAKLESAKQEVSNVEAGVKALEKNSAEQVSLRGELEKKIAAANGAIQLKTGRIDEVAKSLLAYNSDRKAAEGNIEAAKAAFGEVAKELAAQLPQASQR